jgi:hypothetical protein
MRRKSFFVLFTLLVAGCAVDASFNDTAESHEAITAEEYDELPWCDFGRNVACKAMFETVGATFHETRCERWFGLFGYVEYKYYYSEYKPEPSFAGCEDFPKCKWYKRTSTSCTPSQ